MATITESRYAGEFLVSEANGHRSRENVTVAAGADLKAGQVLGVVTASGEYAAYAPGATDGTETAAGILVANVAAASAAKAGAAVVRDAEYNKNEVDGLDAAAEADLAALGLIGR